MNTPISSQNLTLVSHILCPYVQRAAISLKERDIPFERVDIDLSNKPGWFNAISPLGKVPLLSVPGEGGQTPLFESVAILEYLEDSQASPLHPRDALERARHRGWIEFGSQILNRIGALYNAPTVSAFQAEKKKLDALWARLEGAFEGGPWFAGERFSLVDAVFGPIFRYYDVLDEIPAAAFPNDLPKLRSWRGELAKRPSVRNAVSPDYPDHLRTFLIRRESALSALMH